MAQYQAVLMTDGDGRPGIVGNRHPMLDRTVSRTSPPDRCSSRAGDDIGEPQHQFATLWVKGAAFILPFCRQTTFPAA